MQDAQDSERIRLVYQSLLPEMNERMRRQWAAAEARALGWGGVSAVSRAIGLSRVTITAGLAELDLPLEERLIESRRVRRPGGGRPPLTETDPTLLPALESLIEPMTRGDPESSASTTTQRSSPPTVFAAGGREWAAVASGMPVSC